MRQIITWLRDKISKMRWSGLIIPVVVLLLCSFFISLTEEMVYEQESKFDLYAYEAVSSIHSPALTEIMKVITFFGARVFLLPAYAIIAAYFLFYKKNTLLSISIVSVALCGAGVLFLSKNVFKRERPLEPLIDKSETFSYPSGHSFSAFTFAGIILFIIWSGHITVKWKWFWTIFLIMFAATIAFSRVYLNIHFASDVIAGLCLSLIWLSMCYFLVKKLKLVKSKANNNG